MYRVKKALNHNAVVAIDAEKCQEFLILGKGIGFGKKVTEYVEPRSRRHCIFNERMYGKRRGRRHC